MKLLEDFDPRPPEYRGDANTRLPDFLDAMRGEQLCISLLFDCKFRRTTEESILPSSHNIPTNDNLKDTITAFKKSLDVTQEQARDIERNTHDQCLSALWFKVQRFRITASLFGSVFSR